MIFLYFVRFVLCSASTFDWTQKFDSSAWVSVFCHIQLVDHTLPLYESEPVNGAQIYNLCNGKPLASAHGPEIVSVLICAEFTLVLHFRVVPNIQRGRTHTRPNQFGCSYKYHHLKFYCRTICDDFDMPRIHFYFLHQLTSNRSLPPISYWLVGWLVSPSLFNVIEFKYIHFYVENVATDSHISHRSPFSGAGRFAMQIPHAVTMLFFFRTIRFGKSKGINIRDTAATVFASRTMVMVPRCGGDLALHFNQYLPFQLKWWHLLSTWPLWGKRP